MALKPQAVMTQQHVTMIPQQVAMMVHVSLIHALDVLMPRHVTIILQLR